MPFRIVIVLEDVFDGAGVEVARASLPTYATRELADRGFSMLQRTAVIMAAFPQRSWGPPAPGPDRLDAGARVRVCAHGLHDIAGTVVWTDERGRVASIEFARGLSGLSEGPLVMTVERLADVWLEQLNQREIAIRVEA